MLHGVICNAGLIVEDNAVRAWAGAKYDDLLTRFTAVGEVKVGKPKRVKLYKYITIAGKRYFIFPRGAYYDLRAVLQVECTLSSPRRVAYNFDGELYDNQKVVISYLMKHVFGRTFNQSDTAPPANQTGDLVPLQPHGCVTLNMGAGLGKTATSAGLIYMLRHRVIFVAKDCFLQKQAYDELRMFFPASRIVKYGNKQKPTADTDIVVLVVNTAMNLPAAFFRDYGLIIVDEIHTLCGTKRSELFWKLQSKYLFGMSATTNNRIDAMDVVFHRHFGRIVHAKDLPGFHVDDAEFKGEVEVVKYRGDVVDVYHEKTGLLFTPSVIRQLVEDAARNRYIVTRAKELLRLPEVFLYIFCENREHANMIAEILRVEGIAFDMEVEGNVKNATVNAPQVNATVNAPQVNATVNAPRVNAAKNAAPLVNSMMGGIKPKQLLEAVKSRCIVTTYSFGGTGVSIKDMNAAIWGTPRRNGFLQIAARIRRRGSDVKILRRYIDIVDANSLIRCQYNGRCQAYAFYDYKIIHTKAGNRARAEPTPDDEDQPVEFVEETRFAL